MPSVSPLIQQLLQNLSMWQDSLRRTLESFNVPPDNYLPLSGANSADEPTTGLALHLYRTILDPKNTPFSYVSPSLSFSMKTLFFIFKKINISITSEASLDLFSKR